MGVVLFVDGGRQDCIHSGIPHNWFGEVAEECPFVADLDGTTVVVDQTGMPG